MDWSGRRAAQRCGQRLDVEQPVVESGAGYGADHVGGVADDDGAAAYQVRGQILGNGRADELAPGEAAFHGGAPGHRPP